MHSHLFIAGAVNALGLLLEPLGLKATLRSAPEQLLFVECAVAYALWLLRPRALGPPVAMTSFPDLDTPTRELL